MNLRGRNQIGRFREIAEELASKIEAHDGVVGIVFAGGLERGFADKYSDVDILVFLRKKSQVLRDRILRLGSERQKCSGVDVDLEVHFLENFRKRKLSEIHKWDLSHVQVAFDPQGEIRQLLKEKTKVPRSFWIRRIVVCSEYLKWYCCPPRADIGTIAKAWVERGDMVSAHYCVNYGLDLIVNIVYALNRELVPPPKWKFFYSHSLRWLPNDYSRLVKETLSASVLSVKDLNRRLSALRGLWQEILPKIEEETSLTPASMSKYFVEKVLHQA
jgi:predicted nucleotidyltransferase